MQPDKVVSNFPSYTCFYQGLGIINYGTSSRFKQVNGNLMLKPKACPCAVMFFIRVMLHAEGCELKG